nr:uncharacterized protein LOC111984802 [Quercus suber]POE86167.1 hypothetical protein CFP56_07274 [Quercus suber]
MAPRRKPKVTRMDGALEHMRQFGFRDRLVKETVKELLKVYGNDGWYFFESDSYKVLLEALLEKQKNGEQGEDASQDDTGGRDDIKALSAGPSPSSEPIHPSHSKLEAENATIQTNEALDSASQTIETPGASSLTNQLDGKEQSSLEEGETRDSGGSKHLGNNPTCSPPGLHTPQRVDTLPACTRRPCYGWISSNEEQGPLHGTKAPFPKDIARFLLRTDGRRKRKTRWDVRPEDM